MKQATVKKFQSIVWRHFKKHGRDLPWRKTTDPYKIVVSEIMLQQTQVSRGLVKYPEFIKKFPSFFALAKASVRDVLAAWQGLGYNRRALQLKRLSEIVTKQYGGKLPRDPIVLAKLPGIGKATAGSIAVYAFNLPVPFIETNIRKIFIHHFFEDGKHISDRELEPFVKRTVDRENPRLWYQALMDYGAHLSKSIPNPNLKSKHYVRQSKFEGSSRQLRGRVLAYTVERGRVLIKSLQREFPDGRLETVLNQLLAEGFLKKKGRYVTIQ